ncbi:MAG: TetR/AcrR family transcriptional regulator [Solirubrobacteraceae bacterium]
MSAVREQGRTARAPGSGGSALYGKLRPGPGAPREQVAAHQRARICGAVIEIVARGGYGALTVREIVRLAGVSTHTFYEHYADKEECFRDTYALIARRSAQRVLAAQAGGEGWEHGLRAGFRAFAQQLASERKAARLALVEAFGGGRGARERMRSAIGLYEGILASSFSHAPDGAEVPPLLVKGIVSGVARVARTRVMEGRGEELPEIVGELVDWALALRRPQAAAVAALRGSCEPSRHAERPITRRAAPGERDDRQRLIDAALALAASEGYASLTGPRLRALAGIPRKRFLEYFEDAEECFSVGVAQLSRRAMGIAVAVGRSGPDWPRGVYRTIHELCVLVLADPVYAKLAFVESLAPGPEGVRSRDATSSSVARAVRASAPAAARPSELAAEASVGAIWGLIHRHVAAGQARRLPACAPLLAYFAIAPTIGAQDALQALLHELETRS